MNDASSPFELPYQYRAKAPSPARTLDEAIDDDNQICVDITAVSIDSKWGVWLDPKAPISDVQDKKTPIRIYRARGGYSVDLSYAARELKKVWVASMTDSFADKGFIPATTVM